MQLSLEDQFLLFATRVGLETGGNDELQTVLVKAAAAASFDWDYVLAASMRHAVAPLVGHGLSRFSRGPALETLVPPQVCAEFATCRSTARARNKYLLSTANEIGQAFEEAKIKVIGLKDLGLITEIFSDVGLRPMGDLDLLIHREDIERATDCLADLRFLPNGHPETPYRLKYGFGRSLRRSSDNVWIDLQWNVMEREWRGDSGNEFRYPIGRMWQNSIPHPNPRLPLRIPGNEDMLFHLCGHAEGHDYAELILLCEIAKFLQEKFTAIDWSLFLELVDKTNSAASAYYSLLAAERLFAAPMPDGLMNELTPAFFSAGLARPVFSHLGPLHESLDAIYQSGHVQPSVLDGFEKQVRKQAVGASHIYAEVNRVLAAMVPSLVPLVFVSGRPSDYIFPNAPVERFGTMSLLMSANDPSFLPTLLKQQGYVPRENGTALGYCRTTRARDDGGILAGEEPLVEIRFCVHDQEGQVAPSPPMLSKRQLAWQTLATRRIETDAESPISVQVSVLDVPPESIAVELAAALGKQEHDTILGMFNLAQCLEHSADRIDPASFWRYARQKGVVEESTEGLKRVSVLTDTGGEVLLRNGPRVDVPTKCCFARGRYSIDSSTQDPHFKRPFYFVFVVASIGGFAAKAKFILRSLQMNSPKTSLWGVVADGFKGIKHRLGFRPPSQRSVFWMEIPGAGSGTQGFENSVDP